MDKINITRQIYKKGDKLFTAQFCDDNFDNAYAKIEREKIREEVKEYKAKGYKLYETAYITKHLNL